MEPLAKGFCFGACPRWFEGLLWFSDMLGEAVHTVDLRGAMGTLPLPGHAPSGLGFRPDGSLLIASAEKRVVLRYDGETVETLADLAGTANLGDMVIDDVGRAYIGCQGGGVIVRVDPDNRVTVVAEELDFPRGMVMSADRGAFIVAESTGRRLTAFTIGADGGLSDRQTFADGLDAAPHGITLDAEGGVWTAMGHAFERIMAGGAVTDRIDIGDRAAIACTLGGPERRTLFLLSNAWPESRIGTRLSRLDTVTVDIPGAGLP